MTSAGVNVLRYTALGSGIFYGFSHQSSLTAATKSAQQDREYKHKESLMAKAKAEWTKRTMPEDQKTRGGDVISDPEDPKFDLEAFLNTKMAEQA